MIIKWHHQPQPEVVTKVFSVIEVWTIFEKIHRICRIAHHKADTQYHWKPPNRIVLHTFVHNPCTALYSKQTKQETQESLLTHAATELTQFKPIINQPLSFKLVWQFVLSKIHVSYYAQNPSTPL